MRPLRALGGGIKGLQGGVRPLSLDPQNRPPRTMDFGRNIIELELILHPNG